MFRQLAIIIGCLAVGEFITWLTGISVPSSIIGMLLLTFLLKVKVKSEVSVWEGHVNDMLYLGMALPGVAMLFFAYI